MHRGKGRSFVGFLLTYFLTSILVSTCILVSLKCTVLKGNGIKEFIKSLDIGEVVQEVVNESIKSTSSENDAVVDSVNKLADKIITDDVINEVTDVMVDAIIEDKEVDLTNVKDSCMDVVTEVSEQAVEDILDELKGSTSVIDAEALKNNSVIQQYQNDFNIDVTTPILEQMENVYGSKSVELKDIDIEEVKSEAKEALKEEVIPNIEKDVDKLINETSVEVNKQIVTIKKETNIKGITKVIDWALSAVTKAIIVGIFVTAVFAALQFVVYKKDINKAFKNVGIAGIITSIIMLGISIAINVVLNIIKDVFGGQEAADKVVNSITDKYMPKVGGVASTIAIVGFVVSVALIIAAVIVKKKLAQKDELFTTEDTFVETQEVNEESVEESIDESIEESNEESVEEDIM